MSISYKRIQKLRSILIDELKAEVPVFLPRHYELVEARLQTMIMAQIAEDTKVDRDIEDSIRSRKDAQKE